MDTTVHACTAGTWMQVEEVVDFLGLTRSTVTRMAAAGRIPGAFKPARRWLFRRDAFEAWVEENDPGRMGASPLLLVQGGQDILVLPARTAALFDRLCGLGQVVDQLDVPTGDHNTVTDLARADISTWVAARFAGEPAVDDC